MIVASYGRVCARASVAAHHGWLRAPATNSAGILTTFSMKYWAASPRRPSASIVLYCWTWSAGGRALGSRMNGGSHIASFVIRPGRAAAAYIARTAPDDEP